MRSAAHRLHILPIAILATLGIDRSSANAETLISGQMEVELSQAEQTTLKLILNREDTLRDLTAAVSGLEAINSIASQVVSGPAKLIIIWNKGNIEAWKSANDALSRIAEVVTCNEINTEIVTATSNSDNERFWQNLAATSGCT